jgi:hypothetical protein
VTGNMADRPCVSRKTAGFPLSVHTLVPPRPGFVRVFLFLLLLRKEKG